VEYSFNLRYGTSRRDVYLILACLILTATGWQVVGRQGGADGVESLHYFETEADARMMLETAAPELSSWAEMTVRNDRYQ
jgi:hypothetical protein